MARPRKNQQIDILKLAVEATIDLLDHHEANSITLADVATAIRCRAPALYTHFTNKKALLRAVHDEGFRMMLDDKQNIAKSATHDALNRLREGGLAYTRFAFSHPGLYRLMFGPSPIETLTGNPFVSDPGARCLAVLRSAVEACQAAGYLPDADASEVAFLMWSTVHGSVSLVLQGRAPVQEGQNAGSATDVMIDMLITFIRSTRVPEQARNFKG